MNTNAAGGGAAAWSHAEASLPLRDMNLEVRRRGVGTAAHPEARAADRLVDLGLFFFALVVRHGRAGVVVVAAFSLALDDVAARDEGLVHGVRMEVTDGLVAGGCCRHRRGSRRGHWCVAGQTKTR